MSTGTDKRSRRRSPPSAQRSSSDGAADELEPRGGGGGGGSRCCGKSGGGGGGGEEWNSSADGSGDCCCDRCVHRCVVCTVTLTRLCLIAPNLAFLLFGGTLIGVGVMMKTDRESSFYSEVLRNLPASPLVTFDRVPFVFIVVGSCVAILSFLGCCGACTESTCFIYLYMLLIVAVLITEIVLGIVVVAMRNQILLRLDDSMQNQIRYEYNATDLRKSKDNRTFHHLFTDAWNKMQNEFSCCGAVGPEDYQDSAWYNRTRKSVKNKIVPLSCCYQSTEKTVGRKDSIALDKRDADCQLEASRYLRRQMESSSVLKTQGCRESMVKLLQQNLTVVIGVVSSLVMLQMANLVFACVLMRFVRKKQESWYDCETDCANNDCAAE